MRTNKLSPRSRVWLFKLSTIGVNYSRSNIVLLRLNLSFDCDIFSLPAPASFRACVDSECVGGKASEKALPLPGLCKTLALNIILATEFIVWLWYIFITSTHHVSARYRFMVRRRKCITRWACVIWLMQFKTLALISSFCPCYWITEIQTRSDTINEKCYPESLVNHHHWLLMKD
jgi:hypothetical protein